MRLHTKNITQIALISCLGIILGYVENLIPIFKTLPGVKIGISNIVLLYAIVRLGYKEVLTVGIIKAVVSGFLFSGVMSIMYSLAGVLLSVTVMWLLLKFYPQKISLIGISVSGSACFNIGQIIVCCIILLSTAPLYYLVFLLICSVFSGAVTGYVTKLLLDRGI